jgi:hypothetical protein
MSYRMLEELQNRRKEKVAVFLTFENIVGLILVFFPVFLGSSALPLLIRGPLCIGAAALGVALTLEVQGLAIYEQLLWHIRGVIRLRTRGNIVTPDDLAGAITQNGPERPLPLAGPIQTIERATGAVDHRGDRLPPAVVVRAESNNGHLEQGVRRADYGAH